jgi:hypothetical protein
MKEVIEGIQRALKAAGFTGFAGRPLTVDGKWGSNTEQIIGIVAQSRSSDLKPRYQAMEHALQRDGFDADGWFVKETTDTTSSARTVPFVTQPAEPRHSSS